MTEKFKKYIYSTSILGGTIVGVGLFSLPYIAAQVGLKVFLAYFFIVGFLALVVHVLFAEVALKTPDFLRFSGYAKTHLGRVGKEITSFSVIVSLWGSLLAYLIVGGRFLSGILKPLLGENETFSTFLYFAIGALFIYFGVKAISKIEFWGLVLFIVVLLLIALRGMSNFQMSNLSIAMNPKDLFLPYGPILYALWGAALIPEAEEILGKDKKKLGKITAISVIIPILIYIFFTIIMVGIAGKNIAPEAFTSLEGILGYKFYFIGLFFGFLTTFTSFIALGLTLKKIFWYDYKIKKNMSWAITCFVPLALFFFGFQNFINVIGCIGGVFLGITGILIIVMYQKIKKDTLKVKVLTMPLILVFIVGIIYQIIYFLK